MPQTILAILAMAVASLLALQHHRHIAHQQLKLVRTEIALQATGVAEDVLNEVGALAFDQAVVDEPISNASQLTGGPPFAPDKQGDDIDDFHQLSEIRHRLIGSDSLNFRANVSVTYADHDKVDQPMQGPTKVKKVTVRVYSLDIGSPDTVVVSRPFSCGTRCSW